GNRDVYRACRGQFLGDDGTDIDAGITYGEDASMGPDEVLGRPNLAGSPTRLPIPGYSFCIGPDNRTRWCPKNDDGAAGGTACQNSCRQGNNTRKYFHALGLRHRALAALAAIWERFFGVRAAALAAPPLSPPSRPRATA